jgi:hypothetical protein
MPIENIPEIYSQDKEFNGLFVYDFKMTNNVVKKQGQFKYEYVFLQVGKKQVHFADTQ